MSSTKVWSAFLFLAIFFVPDIALAEEDSPAEEIDKVTDEDTSIIKVEVLGISISASADGERETAKAERKGLLENIEVKTPISRAKVSAAEGIEAETPVVKASISENKGLKVKASVAEVEISENSGMQADVPASDTSVSLKNGLNVKTPGLKAEISKEAGIKAESSVLQSSLTVKDSLKAETPVANAEVSLEDGVKLESAIISTSISSEGINLKTPAVGAEISVEDEAEAQVPSPVPSDVETKTDSKQGEEEWIPQPNRTTAPAKSEDNKGSETEGFPEQDNGIAENDEKNSYDPVTHEALEETGNEIIIPRAGQGETEAREFAVLEESQPARANFLRDMKDLLPVESGFKAEQTVINQKQQDDNVSSSLDNGHQNNREASSASALLIFESKAALAGNGSGTGQASSNSSGHSQPFPAAVMLMAEATAPILSDKARKQPDWLKSQWTNAPPTPPPNQPFFSKNRMTK
ncbi:hypothetical protein [Bacillus sp. UMB0728]|uniref:hypothetical protein n=1 Tax=Bacillus sp. UMB0728 TaxID=2066052 RepID=UPI000C75C669|nr:hypothetical protein [Bacillus sp. UMB0728]PLR74740.1 hypothetical protein CYJ37_03720 [Bacillus sp. UMB0728]